MVTDPSNKKALQGLFEILAEQGVEITPNLGFIKASLLIKQALTRHWEKTGQHQIVEVNVTSSGEIVIAHTYNTASEGLDESRFPITVLYTAGTLQ